MKNFRLTIEYDGTAYQGWQRQGPAPTIQAEIEKAIRTITRMPAVVLHGAGRTDAGVHALGQVASFHAETRLGPEALGKGLNGLLPPDIAVLDCRTAADDFHARYHARSKIYRYRIVNRPVRPAIGRAHAWFIHRPLDLAAMERAAACLVGTRDFKAFENAGSPRKHTVRTVAAAGWRTHAPGEAVFTIEADGFLRGMVRNIVGTLAAVGLGRIDADEVAGILASRDRRRAGATAPPQGLFLVEVRYGPEAAA
jgi:tRNA pseudouridine38-40 synthase